MKTFLAVLVLVPVALQAQQSATVRGGARLEIRSVDTSRVLQARATFDGRLFDGMSVPRLPGGTVYCGPSGCVATTPSQITLSVHAGTVSLSLADSTSSLEVRVLANDSANALVIARGRDLSFSRTANGDLTVRASQVSGRF